MIQSIDIGPITLQVFGLFVALAFLAAGAVLYKRFSELGWDPDLAYEFIGAALVGGIAGARLWWALGDPGALVDDPAGRLFGGSGLTWYGGALGGALAVWGVAIWRGLPLWEVAGAAVPSLALGYALGRIGCQISGDGDYGIPSSVPWAMPYPDGVVPTQVAVHPTPIYETLAIGVLALLLWQMRDRWSPQLLVATYLIGSGIERFIVEFWRRNPDVEGFLTVAQLSSVLLMVAGGVLIFRARGGGRPGGTAAST